MTATALKPIEGLTVKETAYMLGVSPKTVYGWCSDGKLPHFKVFGTIRIKREVVDFLKSCALPIDIDYI